MLSRYQCKQSNCWRSHTFPKQRLIRHFLSTLTPVANAYYAHSRSTWICLFKVNEFLLSFCSQKTTCVASWTVLEALFKPNGMEPNSYTLQWDVKNDFVRIFLFEMALLVANVRSGVKNTVASFLEVTAIAYATFRVQMPIRHCNRPHVLDTEPQGPVFLRSKHDRWSSFLFCRVQLQWKISQNFNIFKQKYLKFRPVQCTTHTPGIFSYQFTPTYFPRLSDAGVHLKYTGPHTALSKISPDIPISLLRV